MADHWRNRIRSAADWLTAILGLLLYLLLIAVIVWGTLATAPHLKYFNWQ